MVYYLYRTENLLSGKYYIGKRQYNGDDVNKDVYLGSGKVLKLAIKKYGRQNFKKQVLQIVNSLSELNELEKSIITEDVINDELSYNLALGGWGGNLGAIVNEKLKLICSSPSYREKMSKIINSPEVKDRMIASVKKTMSDLGWKENFSEIQRKVQNTTENRKRNSDNQKSAQVRVEVVTKKRDKMNTLYKDVSFKQKHKSACENPEFREKQRKKVLGKKWINNGIDQKYVSSDLLKTYLDDGWILGMFKRKQL